MKHEGKELQDEDLWGLSTQDRSLVVCEKFEQAWTKESAKVLEAEAETQSDEEAVPNSATTTKLTGPQAVQVVNKSLWDLIGSRMRIAGIAKFVNSTAQFTYPLLLNRILVFIQDVAAGTNSNNWEGYFFGVLLGVMMMVKALAENTYFFNSFRSGWQARTAVSTQIYRKSLRLSASARQAYTLGEMVNLMQLDSLKMEIWYAMGFHVMWDGIYQIVGYMIILYVYIGWAAFVGLAVMFLVIPVQVVIFKKLMGINRAMVKDTDSRVKSTNEVLQGILGVKMAAWENQYAQVIRDSRAKELAFLKRNMYLGAFSSAYMFSIPAIVAVVALTVYAVNANGVVDAATLFTALSAFGQLRFPLMFYPQALNHLAQMRVSRKRIADFIALDEVQEDRTSEYASSSGQQNNTDDNAIVINQGTFSWGASRSVVSANQAKATLDAKNKGKVAKKKKAATVKGAESSGDIEAGLAMDATSAPQELEEPHATLEDINLTVARNSLTALVGTVGVGKSSLVSAIIGEIKRDSGSVAVSGSVAYAAQSAWILNATIRENILFGEPLDESRYRKVIKACQLAHDLEILQDGDQTMIGERGINLSGGQKQRVSVARAAYSSKEIVILDDPLSALDPEVAAKLFSSCILKFMKGRTRVLVTNQLNVLKRCDKIVCLASGPDGTGRIAEQSTYDNLVASGQAFSKLMKEFESADSEDAEEKQVDVDKIIEEQLDEVLEEEEKGAGAEGKGKKEEEEESRNTEYDRAQSSMSVPESDDKNVLKLGEGKSLMQVEERAMGAVKNSQYAGYAKAAGGFCIVFFVLLAFVFNQATYILNTAWITLWSDDNTYLNNTFTFYLVGYALTAILIAAVTYCRSILTYYAALQAGKSLHEDLLQSVLHAPMSFFDTTPIGRIISRFSKDLYLIDTQLPMTISFFLFTSIFVLATIITIAVTTPPFLIAVPFLAWFYYRSLQRYRPIARDAKRLESISRSPVFAHFSETLGGLSTIRAFDMAGFFSTANISKLDNNLRSFVLIKSLERWIAVRLEFLGSTASILAAVLCVWSASQGHISAGLAGLSLSFSMGLTNLLNQTVRQAAELEGAMNSVERILHYGHKIEQEAPFTSSNPPEPSWPAQGAISIKNLSMRYRAETPLVLRDVSIEIPAGYRIGVVGRTGSGKSSMLLTLLRLVEPEGNFQYNDKPGPIWIDGVDSSKIGLHELRSKIGIVQQTPTIFSGTVRSNVDPFTQYSEAEIWEALAKCEMTAAVKNLGGLDGDVSEYGENFSQGERQLLCLARVVLQKPKVLLLDECSSSVDHATDQAINNTIAESFPGTTIITIAHRAASIIAADRILVLSDGVLAEYDEPIKLLQREDSHFSSMVNQLGPGAARNLTSRASAASQRRLNMNQ